LLAVAGVLTLAPAFAKDPAEPESKPNQQSMPAHAAAQPGQVTIPEYLAKLNLSPQQRDQVKEIVRDYDSDLASVWSQFSDRYTETIRTETMLLAAIEDDLTEAQRTQVRDQRRKVAQHEKSLAGTNTKPNQSIAQPASAIEESIAVVGVSLTPEQEALADKTQEKYLSRLRSLNRDIQGLHTRLLSLEADKLVEIEKDLTKDQLKQLRDSRQTAPSVALKAAINKSGAAKTE
jgi:Spy/CpxP family protein refolding chaperone